MKKNIKLLIILGCFIFVLIGFYFIHVSTNDFNTNIENISNNKTYSFEENEFYLYLIAENYNIRISLEDWTSLDKSSFTYKEANNFLAYCAHCIELITEQTGKYSWMDQVRNVDKNGKTVVTIDIQERIISRTSALDGIIILNKDAVEINFVPIEHELTHLIMGVCNEGTLSEGFACYIAQTKLGIIDVPEFELDPDTVTIACMDIPYQKSYEVFMDAVGYAHDSSIKHREGGVSFYVFAHSYTKYLVDTYGMNGVIELYDANGSEEAYHRITGKDISTIKSEWILFLEQQEPDMASEEVFSYILEQRELYQVDKIKIQ